MRRFVGRFFLLLLIIETSGILFCQPYKTKVTASYYAEKFHGKKTSNGERFNMYSLTCAHKELPFNTVIKVTNLSNGKFVLVRVNDRGPFVKGREIDLSKAAAVELGMIKTGTAKVNLDIITWGPDTKVSRQTAQKSMARMGLKWTNPGPQKIIQTGFKKEVLQPGTFWDIQLGAFGKKDNALKYAKEAQKAGIKGLAVQSGENVYRVVVRNVPAEKIQSIEKLLQEKGYGYIIRPRAKVKE